MTLSEETPIIVFGDDWRRHVSTIQHLFMNLIGRRPIVWVNSFGHRAPQLTLYDLKRVVEKVRSMLGGYRVPLDSGPAPARIIEPRALPWHNLAVVRALNTWSLKRDITKALHDVAPGKRPVLITGTPASVGIVGKLGEVASIYFCMDDYGELPGVDKEIVAPLERKLLRKIDATVATATTLVELKRPASGRSFPLSQGVNYDHFATPQTIPRDIAALPRPILGFAGGVSTAIDFDLISAIADAHPSASVVFVGPLQPDVRAPKGPNIHLLGNKPYDVLPAYVQTFDVGLIPYILNDWTRSVDPLKLLEYLAAGIPVVTTAIPEVMKYASAVHIGRDVQTFLNGVTRALNEPASARAGRQAVARQHTWAKRADRLMEIASQVIAEKQR